LRGPAPRRDRPGERTGCRMAKKSKKTAARYSELSRTRKKKRQAGRAAPLEAAAAASQEAAPERQRPAPRSAPRPAQRAQADPRRGLPGYEYVREDLRRLAVLAGGMIVVLIILAFVLG
jgi:hypothetical protein